MIELLDILESSFYVGFMTDLRTSRPFDLSTGADRRIAAVVSAVNGIVMATYFFAVRLADDADSSLARALVTFVYLALFGVVAEVQRRLASTVPRGSQRLTYIGFGLLFVVGMVFTIAFNIAERDGEVLSIWWYAAAAIATACPSLIAALIIMRRR